MLIPSEQIPQRTHMQVGNDVLEGVETPQGFQLSRIHSTDPAAYLRSEFAPGSYYRGNV